LVVNSDQILIYYCH